MGYEAEVRDEFGTTVTCTIHDALAEAKRVARDGAKTYQGVGQVCDREDDALVIEYRYEGGNVYGYDGDGNAISAIDNFGR